MLDGYTETKACLLQFTVGSCHSSMSARDTSAIDKYFYASGHFQKHAAVDLGLSSKNASQLATEIHDYLGNDWTFTYSRTDLAGGGKSSAADYAKFLRKILNGTLLLSGGALGSHAVCTYTGPTDPLTGRVNCAQAQDSPSNEDTQYSLGHWVENDPQWLAGGGDPAYSSPGLAGFYPWIDSSRTYYGIVARVDLSQGAGAASTACGRQIRKAWLTGIAQ
jgi:CubicO group peptidase (beta-lactamase class C family)